MATLVKGEFTLATAAVSLFSEVDCVNAKIENFLSLCGNATVYCGIHPSVNES